MARAAATASPVPAIPRAFAPATAGRDKEPARVAALCPGFRLRVLSTKLSALLSSFLAIFCRVFHFFGRFGPFGGFGPLVFFSFGGLGAFRGRARVSVFFFPRSAPGWRGIRARCD